MSVWSVFIDAPVALLQLFGSREVAFSIAYGILGAAVLPIAETLQPSHYQEDRQSD